MVMKVYDFSIPTNYLKTILKNAQVFFYDLYINLITKQSFGAKLN